MTEKDYEIQLIEGRGVLLLRQHRIPRSKSMLREDIERLEKCKESAVEKHAEQMKHIEADITQSKQWIEEISNHSVPDSPPEDSIDVEGDEDLNINTISHPDSGEDLDITSMDTEKDDAVGS